MKNLIKPLVAAVSAVALTLTPVEARVDEGTYELIQTVEELGFQVHINSLNCTPGYAGMFVPQTESIHLCKGEGPATADEHDTVRHEVFHIIQYCDTPKRARVMHPYTNDKETFVERVTDSLSRREIRHVMDSYPKNVHVVELEAFAAANTLTAKQIQNILIKECS